MNLEKLAKQIFNECQKDGEPVTMEEAMEMAQMEIKSKENGRHYEQKEKQKKTTKQKVRKVDEEKKAILLECKKTLLEKYSLENITEKTETELNFSLNGNSYCLKLTKHRKQKGGITYE